MNERPSGSFVVLASADVEKMAEKCIEAVRQGREEKKRKAIERAAKEFERSWWNKLLRRALPSEAVLWEKMRRGPFYEADFIKITYFEQEQTAKKLLAAARLAPAFMCVSIDDLARITVREASDGAR